MALVTAGFNYDVFLSFRGEDTRHGFTGYLRKALNDRGIRTFMDDEVEELQKGEETTPSLVKAIEQSRMAIIVFSKNYASSSFCLQELSKILDCSIKEKRRLVLPVFYDVDPSDVRNLSRTYGEAMVMHDARYNDNMDKTLQKWKNALHQVACLPRYTFKDRVGYDEFELIEIIVDEVSWKLNLAPFHTDYLVGLEEVCSLLELEYDEQVLTVGIYGMDRKGKTTLAQAVYNRIAHQFDGSCFLGDVRENSNKHGLVFLQNMLLSEIVGEKDIQLGNTNEGVSIIRRMLQQKKVLLILDDVDTLEQLEALVGEPNWFGSGSRIIITTLDRHLLAFHGIERTYGVPVPQVLSKLTELLQYRSLRFVSPKLAKLLKTFPSVPLQISQRLSEVLQTFPSVHDSVLQISRRLPEVLQILPSVSEVVLQISPSALEVLQISQRDCEDETKWRLVGLVSSWPIMLCSEPFFQS